MWKFCVCIAAIAVCKAVIGQNLEAIMCRGDVRIVCVCDNEISKAHSEDVVYPKNVEKILNSVATTIENCDKFVFDTYLATMASTLQTLAIRNVSELVLEALPTYIENLYISNVDSVPVFNRELFVQLDFLDNLIFTNVVIHNFSNDSFFGTLIYKAQFDNVVFANISKDFFFGSNFSAEKFKGQSNDFILKTCSLYDVSKLIPMHFLNSNVCEYELITHTKEYIDTSNSNSAFSVRVNKLTKEMHFIMAFILFLMYQ